MRALLLLPLLACRGADKGGLGNDPGAPAWVEVETSDGDAGRVDDSFIADGPGFVSASGGVTQAIITVMDDGTAAYYAVSLLGKEAGIQAGDVCRDFNHLAESTGGCDWFSGGTADIPLASGARYDPFDWTETDGTLTVTDLFADASGTYLSFEFELTLAQAGRTATVTGDVQEAWISP